MVKINHHTIGVGYPKIDISSAAVGIKAVGWIRKRKEDIVFISFPFGEFYILISIKNANGVPQCKRKLEKFFVLRFAIGGGLH